MRLRKVVRALLVPVIGLQVIILVAIAVPETRAYPATVTNFIQIKGFGINGNTLAAIANRVRGVERELETGAIKRNTDNILDDTNDLVDYADQHSQSMGNNSVNTFSVAEVSQTPVETAFAAHRPTVAGPGLPGQANGHLGYTNQQAVSDMTAIMPGATAWGNYHTEYIRSADATLMSLRASVAALQGFDQNMQQDQQRINQLLSRTRSSDSRLAVGQLQVEGQMELARQIQALRAQQALQTNIYAVTESHRVGSEARSIAKDRKSACQIMAMLGGGIAGGIVGEVGATVGSNLLCD